MICAHCQNVPVVGTDDFGHPCCERCLEIMRDIGDRPDDEGDFRWDRED